MGVLSTLQSLECPWLLRPQLCRSSRRHLSLILKRELIVYDAQHERLRLETTSTLPCKQECKTVSVPVYHQKTTKLSLSSHNIYSTQRKKKEVAGIVSINAMTSLSSWGPLSIKCLYQSSPSLPSRLLFIHQPRNL